MTDYMLTTVDNPWNPFTNFDEWQTYDVASGYYTTNFLARVVRTSEALSDSEQEQAIEDAIDEIVRENVLGLYKKVESPQVSTVTSIAVQSGGTET